MIARLLELLLSTQKILEFENVYGFLQSFRAPCINLRTLPCTSRFITVDHSHLRCICYFFFNLHSGGWSPNWVHSVCRPFIGLLYLPRVIVRMENLVESMAGESEVLGENLPQRHFVHQKSHLTRPGIEPGPPRW
jgi:hypothetical protein